MESEKAFITNYLYSAGKQFKFYKVLAEKTIDQLEDDMLFLRKDEFDNSISVIVNHLSGNMKSRWTDFLTSDGEKAWRERDMEFEEKYTDKNSMIQDWEASWNILFETLSELNPGNFQTPVFIRNTEHTIVEAINRQLCHYAYHVGQIVLIGKQLLSDNWKSLSIPKGASKKYNSEKFSHDKQQNHFTDEFLNDSNQS